MGLLSKQSRAPPAHGRWVLSALSSSFPPNSQLPTQGPHPLFAFQWVEECGCPSPGGSSAGRQQSREGEPWAGLHLESKGQGLQCGPPLDPTFLTHPHPKQKASQPPFIPEVPVFTPICANVTGSTVKEGSKSPIVLALALACTPRCVCGGDRNTLGRSHFSGGQALGCSA